MESLLEARGASPISRGEIVDSNSTVGRLDPEPLERGPEVVALDRAFSLGAEEATVTKAKGTLSGFFTRIANFFTSEGRSRNALAKPTSELTSAIKFIDAVNAKLQTIHGQPFEKVTFANLPQYIEAIKHGNVLVQEEVENGAPVFREVNPCTALDAVGPEEFLQKQKAMQLFSLTLLMKDLNALAKEHAIGVKGSKSIKEMLVAVTQTNAVELFETAAKTVKVWQNHIENAGKGLNDAEFRGLVQAATEIVAEADPTIDRVSLQQNTAKLWADNIIERFTSEFAASVAPTMTDFDGKVDLAIAKLSKIKENAKREELIEKFKVANENAEPEGEDLAKIERAVVEHMSKNTVKTQIQQQAWNDVMKIQKTTLQEKLAEIQARAEELSRFTRMNPKSSKAKILGQLQATPEFASARAEMAEAVKKVADSQRTFSTVAKDALASLRSFHTAILMSGKGTKETTSLAENAVALDFRNANRGLAILTDVYRADTSNPAPDITAKDVLTRAKDADGNIKNSRDLSDIVLSGHEEAVKAAEAVAVQAEFILEALNTFNVESTPVLAVEKAAIEAPVVSREISEELLEEVSILLDTTNEEESVSSPTLLRQLLLIIQSKKGGLTNVLGIDNETDIEAMFQGGEQLDRVQVGLEKDGEVLYTFQKGAKAHLEEIVRDRKEAIQAEKQRRLANEARRAEQLGPALRTPSLEDDKEFDDGPPLSPSSSVVEPYPREQPQAVCNFFGSQVGERASRFREQGKSVTSPALEDLEESDKLVGLVPGTPRVPRERATSLDSTVIRSERGSPQLSGVTIVDGGSI